MSEQNTGSGSGYGAQELCVAYDEVAAKIAELNNRNGVEMGRIKDMHNHVRFKLDTRDSATNAALIEVAELNKVKSLEIAQTLQRLFDFVATASKHVEYVETVVIAPDFQKVTEQ